jgi:hypothetical protein
MDPISLTIAIIASIIALIAIIMAFVSYNRTDTGPTGPAGATGAAGPPGGPTGPPGPVGGSGFFQIIVIPDPPPPDPIMIDVPGLLDITFYVTNTSDLSRLQISLSSSIIIGQNFFVKNLGGNDIPSLESAPGFTFTGLPPSLLARQTLQFTVTSPTAATVVIL